MKSKQRNSRKSLLLMHPTLSWCCLQNAIYLFLVFFTLLSTSKAKPTNATAWFSVSAVSLSGRIPVLRSGQTKMPGNDFLCDLVASLQGLTRWKMGHVHRYSGRTNKRIHWQSLEFVTGHGPFVAISALTLGLETTCPSNVNSALMHHLLFFWKSERPFQTQVMVI